MQKANKSRGLLGICHYQTRTILRALKIETLETNETKDNKMANFGLLKIVIKCHKL